MNRIPRSITAIGCLAALWAGAACSGDNNLIDSLRGQSRDPYQATVDGYLRAIQRHDEAAGRQLICPEAADEFEAALARPANDFSPLFQLTNFALAAPLPIGQDMASVRVNATASVDGNTRDATVDLHVRQLGGFGCIADEKPLTGSVT